MPRLIHIFREYHPWRQENMRNGDYRPTYLLSTDPKIETGDISMCTQIDVHFIQTGACVCCGVCVCVFSFCLNIFLD